MISKLYVGLIDNTCLLLTAGVIYFALSFKDVKYAMSKKVFGGVIFGIIGIFIMSSPIELVPGIVFDTRSILISVVGMFFGLIPTIIAAITMCIYRILLGGSGTIMGISVIISSAGVGLLWNKFRLKHIVNKKSSAWLEFYVFGLVNHIIMLLCTLALPREMVFNVFQNISAPVIIIYPIGSFLLCMIIFKHLLSSEINLKLKESEEKYRLLTENISDVISVLNLTKRKITYVSPSIYHLRGLTVEEAMNETMEEALTPESVALLREAISRNSNSFKTNLTGYHFYIVEVQQYCKNGNTIWVELSSKYLYNSDGDIEILVASRNIEERKKMEEAIKASELKHKAMIENISDVISIIDQNGILKYKSPNVEKLFGWKPSDILSAEVWGAVHPNDQERIKGEINLLLTQDMLQKTMECKYLCKNGLYKDIELTAVNLTNDSNINGILINYHDITERKLKGEEILYNSSHDILTGLYNRRRFEEVLDFLEESSDLPISIIVGDVNGLKLINDAYGHSSGDIILKKIAEIMKEVCGANAYAARRGGDEFAVIIPNANYEEACLKVKQIKKRCEQESKDELMLNITFGVGTKTGKEQTLGQSQHLAEERMYTSKLLEGKNIRSTIVENLRMVLEEKTGETRNHCNRMSEMSQFIGEKMGFQAFEIANLKLLSLLHDIGKTAIPESIILKPGKLTDYEFSIMQKHCEIGYRIANTMPELIPIAEGILCHHERWDGTGYPQGLVGENIPIISRIVSVLDAYDAMINERPYRKALSKETAIEELKRCSGTQFDPEIVDIFLNKVLNYYGQ